MKKIAVYGAGGFAREVAWLLTAQERNEFCRVVGYVDDADNRPQELNGKPVFSLAELKAAHPDALIAIGIGDPHAREKVAKRCIEAGFHFTSATHHTVEESNFNWHGEGCIICAGSILTVNITLGDHVHINLDCTIGHDVKIGDFSTLSPGVHVSGHVHIGKRVYVGTGAVFINGTEDAPIVIEDDCVIGAGACITQSTKGRAMYAGVPATLKRLYG